MRELPLNILIVAAEMVPFIKTGGVADVVGALPKALRLLGHDVRVAIPCYAGIDRPRAEMQLVLEAYPVPIEETVREATLLQSSIPVATHTIPVYLVANEHYFDRSGIYSYNDDADRFIFFCRAVLEGIRRLDWVPDVIHCHDWPSAIIPNWLKTLYRDDPFYARMACLYTIHNLAFQGIFGYRVLEVAGVDEYGFVAHPDTPHLNDVVDFMGRGIYFADIINTVSERYADEILTPEFGEGLDPFLRDRRDRLYGILNGIDTDLHNPATDPHIAAQYTSFDLSGKRRCKEQLQREAQLSRSETTPLIGMVSRLVAQKGLDLLDQILEPLLHYNAVQVVILGTGDDHYHQRLNELRDLFPEQIAFVPVFSQALSQTIFAGADLFLMPSRYEPCGLGQMVALRYGTIPVVRSVGGLADTVQDFDPTTGVGNGFAFHDYHAMALYTTLVRAIETYRHTELWRQLIRRAMAENHSWEISARRYVDLYRRALAVHGISRR